MDYNNLTSKEQPEVPSYSTNEVSPLYCICCNKEINPLYKDDLDSKTDPSVINWNDAVVCKISAGYGSCLDGAVYLIAICDSCLEQKNKEGKAIFISDYISRYEIEDRRKELNKALHRRNKLKRIIK